MRGSVHEYLRRYLKVCMEGICWVVLVVVVVVLLGTVATIVTVVVVKVEVVVTQARLLLGCSDLVFLLDQ